jgi:hypothetical protein
VPVVVQDWCDKQPSLLDLPNLLVRQGRYTFTEAKVWAYIGQFFEGTTKEPMGQPPTLSMIDAMFRGMADFHAQQVMLRITEYRKDGKLRQDPVLVALRREKEKKISAERRE